MAEIIVELVPDEEPYIDYPPEFPPLHNLRLEYLEDKAKVKPGTPLMPIKREIPRHSEKPKGETATLYPVHPPSHTPAHENNAEASEEVSDDEALNHEPSPVEINNANNDGLDIEPEKHVELSARDMDVIKDLGGDRPTSPVPSEPYPDAVSQVSREPSPRPEMSDVEDEIEEEVMEELSPQEREENERQELMLQLELLRRRKIPGIEIPEYTRLTPVSEIRATYKSLKRRINLEMSIDSYRGYLMVGFGVLEFIATKWLGIDLTGFTKQQAKMMYKYNDYLIELGEKSYNPEGSSLPVEVRLIGFVVFQGFMFYMMKLIREGDVAALMGSVNTTNAPQEQSPKVSPPPRPRGPSLTAEQIRKMHNA